jgi:hypothetical protein
MRGIRDKAGQKTTAQVRRASVIDIPESSAATCPSNCHRAPQFQMLWMFRGLALVSLSILLQVLVLIPMASAARLQLNAEASPSQGAITSPLISESLRPALDQVGQSVGQIQIDHWKVSKDWKQQLQNDANSISGDLSHQLPGLLQQAQATPTALDAQLRLMQNVDALYDVMVRLTLAADLTEKKADAARLDNALQNLEAARKTATAQLLAAAAQQHQQLTELQARVQSIQASEGISNHGKTIVVDNELRHEKAHHTTHRHKKPSPSTTSKSQAKAAPSKPDKPSPQQ